jgi:hypothetical protein
MIPADTQRHYMRKAAARSIGWLARRAQWVWLTDGRATVDA